MDQSVSTHMMLYMSAQNDLAAKATQNIKSIESCCNLNNICTYIMLDTIDSADPDNLDTRKTFHYRLPPAATDGMFVSKRQEMPRDKVVTRPDVFNLILESASRHFQSFTTVTPPKQKILVFWGHGGGMVMLDEVQSNTVQQSRANLKQFADILVRRTERAHPLSFDILAFDSCYMCMIETMNQLRRGTKYVLCSSTIVDDDGFPYDTMFRELKDNGGDLNPVLAATRLAELYNEHYLNYFPDGDRFLFVCDMSKIEACTVALNGLGQKLASMMSPGNPDDGVRKAIKDALVGAGVDSGYVYILSFLRLLAYTLRGRVEAAKLAEVVSHGDMLRSAVHEAFKGNMGDSIDRPISPLVWSPLQKGEFTKNQATYNALESSHSGSGGWADLWRRFHQISEIPVAGAEAAVRSNLGLATSM